MVDKKTKVILGKIYVGILLLIFAGIVVHAPFSVGFGVLFPGYELLIKSWKEILMLVAGVLLLAILYKNKKFYLLRDRILGLIFLYALLHLGMLFVNNGLQASLAGLAIDLRYVLYFSLVYMAMKLYPNYRQVFVKVAVSGALVVLVFAMLQIFVLPIDVLKYIGYGDSTIVPYLTVDLNNEFVRINSTLRGPNPLGAYAALSLVITFAYLIKNKMPKKNIHRFLIGLIIVGSGLALWSSYSRSAFLGLFVSIIAVLVLAIKNRRQLMTKLKKYKIWVIGALIVSVVAGLLLINNQAFVSNVLLHENPDDTNSLNSNEGHVASLGEGINLMLKQPLGDGIGSVGSASLFTDSPLIIENQYLFIAHETGWLGLGLFIWIFVLIMKKLWEKRENWLALGVFAGGIGLAVIGLLLPVWVDDTVSIIWWGMAAVALMPANKK